MSEVVPSGKACSVNPLKLSPALGGAMAFLGLERCLPLLHGSQGCTAFALVLMVRHFREAIPLQTTAMSELTTILGGADNIEEAVANISERAKPRLSASARPRSPRREARTWPPTCAACASVIRNGPGNSTSSTRRRRTTSAAWKRVGARQYWR